MNFCVWAPYARSVDVISGGERLAMVPQQGGYWERTADPNPRLSGYRFSIDGGPPLPDPRSRWQPDGVHGDSQLPDLAPVDHSSFTAKPLRDALIYEMHVGTFTPAGTYAAAAGRLSHLQRLGVTHVELLPIATFPGGRGWGYDGVDLFAPHPAYGTPQELADFIAACHRHQIAVLLDVVYNHLGPDGNYLAKFGPYFTDSYKTGWGSAINYDGPHSDGVRRFVIDNALMWLRDYGFDGLRLDAVHAIFSFAAVHLLEELTQAVSQLGDQLQRRFVLIAESDQNDPRLVRSVERGGLGLDAHWSDDFHHALHGVVTGETAGYYTDFGGLADLALALREGYVFQGRFSPHRRRRHGRPPVGVGPDQLIVCAQNHDQIGNRAQGERLSMLVDNGKLKAIAALTLLSPFVPMLFQGEEWGARTPFLYFTDHENAELGRLIAEGRSKEFSSFSWQGEVPNPQELKTFLRSKLDWTELEQSAHADLYEWHRRLIQLRTQMLARERRAAPAGGAPAAGQAAPHSTDVAYDVHAGWLRLQRCGILALFNLAQHAQQLPRPDGDWNPLFSSVPPAPGASQAAMQVGGPIEVPAGATLIYHKYATAGGAD